MFILGLISAAAILVVVFRCTDVFTLIFVVESFRHGPSLPLLLCFSYVCLCVIVVVIEFFSKFKYFSFFTFF